MSEIVAVRMPKWGLSMQEGTVIHWWKEEGASVSEGEDLVDIETPKITNVFESPQSGLLRRIVGKTGETLPVGALIGVMAPSDIDDTAIDAFVTEFQAHFVPGAEDEESALSLSTIEAGGRTIRVGRAGSGDATPAVLLHGYSGDLNSWLFNIEAIAAERPVIALDLPGHGGSSKDVGNGSLGVLAASAADALETLGVSRAHLVGHSLGGAVAARLAADRPALVASLVLICPSSLPGTATSEAFLDGIIEGHRARDLKGPLEMLFADPSLVTKEMTEDMAKYKRLDGVDDALTRLRNRLVENEDREALANDLGNIPRAIVIATRQDRVVGSPDPNLLPGGFSLRWIESASHMPHMEKATEVNAILSEAMC